DIHWHHTKLFNPGNHFGESTNIFPGIHTHNLLCLPKETAIEFHGVLFHQELFADEDQIHEEAMEELATGGAVLLDGLGATDDDIVEEPLELGAPMMTKPGPKKEPLEPQEAPLEPNKTPVKSKEEPLELGAPMMTPIPADEPEPLTLGQPLKPEATKED
ncbi:MAG: hypothetical protein HQL53_14740, partial [Magnetococcales bacterium]|nr:hypothetical protein [Magnetococcales bacterium]